MRGVTVLSQRGQKRSACHYDKRFLIGERPFEKYTLSFQNGNDKLREFWPAEIKGIDPEGTLFEKASGKKLSYDADVEIGKEYYLLKRGYIYRKSFSSVRIQEIIQKRIGWETWSLYVVSASAFTEDAARFYLDFHCRLTDHPISLQPVWPLFVEGNYIVKHNQNSMYTYQIGGFYYPGSERHHGQSLTPARAYAEDPNYVKQIISCPECGWFGLMEENTKQCPFCGNDDLKITREMMRPWGFAPRNAEAIPDVQLSEEYTAVQQPLYSTLPDAEEMKLAPGCKNIRIASRTNQRIIMLNKGSDDKGFMVCKDCGAAMPGNDISVLNDVNRPYKSKYARSRCRHGNSFNVNLGYDFITDMLVLEFTIDDKVIDARRNDNPWLNRAAQSLAEALRLVASKKLDVEFTELVTGYRLRTGAEASYVDIYLYDSLSSGAGYAVSVADAISELLSDMKELLSSCDCGSACSKCLKHYRNQYVHGMLDRFAALQLLEWGVDGIKASNWRL